MPPHASPSDIPTPQTAFKASSHASDGKTHILLAATGSVASIKIPLILSALSKYSNISIRLVFTTSSLLFIPPLVELLNIPNVDGIHLDHHEWPRGLSSNPAETLDRTAQEIDQETAIWAKIGDPILHIELRRWADILLIAPLSANSLAKIVGGFSDNLLLSVVRAWDTNKPIAVAPAMNTLMWEHPVTTSQIKVLETEWSWFRVLRPVEKLLACGDSGSGAMKEWSTIVSWVVEEMKLKLEGGEVENS
ncbi:hypothetical protein AOL_s00188g103 [Orbilia oligospora ATCC 24927]|uniref:Flavoprotein domain-containing protein n=2 Tax=Orbilia oligospora TaxID=2813651 RepID=G1XQ92_ARTOA|nr:hypothetical protein AOL_s00188g103 [Orbilia oligospora ATCC 24927]EGX44765.1 hypothetical protein AOL_s00188g103 [Orbilia oligospora ATCC 24927]KAF3275047.1 hypothetical protein TWF970_007490 [Orbilia oligospora]